MPIPAVLATLSAIGKAAAASAATTTAASLAATTAAAKAASAVIGQAAAANASSALPSLTPSINAAVAGKGLAGAPGLMGSSGAGFTPSAMPATYSAAMGNPTVGAVPLKTMQPLGLMGNGAGQTSRLSTLVNDPRFKKYSKLASQSLAGGASGGLSGISAPPLQRNQGAPFKPFEFDLANYQYRRPTGY